MRHGAVREAPAWLAGRAIVLASGVGSPSAVRATAERLGALVRDHLVFPDHHAYTAGDLAAALARASRLGAELVVTEKDAIKLARLAPDARDRIAVLEQATEVTEGGERLLREVLTLPPRDPVAVAVSPASSFP